jgi:oxygen-independent coproporphyrinogen III oxidase
MSHAGIYLHIPFCRARCSYCDFATGMFESALADRYVNSLIQEISTWREIANCANVDTIYFGGGTPSLLTPSQIAQISNAVNERFQVADDAEVTLELNPATIINNPGIDDELSSRKLAQLRSLGINRTSFGAQTFDDAELKQLGRTHLSQDIHATFLELRRAGFDNVSFDLIAGLPGQTLEGWRRNLDQALELRPDHLSLYLLDVHEGTPLAVQIQTGMRPRPDDDLAGEMYELMVGKVGTAGYQHYEISNFCSPGFQSRHNTKYWSGSAYYGFGCSAHSYDGDRRRWANERDILKYVESIEHARSPIVERTELNQAEVRSETIFLGLRLMKGLDLEEYRARFGTDLRQGHEADLERLRDAGLIEIDKYRLRLTRRGALLSNEVFATLA